PNGCDAPASALCLPRVFSARSTRSQETRDKNSVPSGAATSFARDTCRHSEDRPQLYERHRTRCAELLDPSFAKTRARSEYASATSFLSNRRQAFHPIGFNRDGCVLPVTTRPLRFAEKRDRPHEGEAEAI